LGHECVKIVGLKPEEARVTADWGAVSTITLRIFTYSDNFSFWVFVSKFYGPDTYPPSVFYPGGELEYEPVPVPKSRAL
jgi:hypothetical protein